MSEFKRGDRVRLVIDAEFLYGAGGGLKVSYHPDAEWIWINSAVDTVTVERLPETPPPMERKPAPPRWASITSLHFSTRLHNCLVRNGIASVGQLVDSPEQELTDIRNFGSSCLAEVKAVLAAHGLELRS